MIFFSMFIIKPFLYVDISFSLINFLFSLCYIYYFEYTSRPLPTCFFSVLFLVFILYLFFIKRSKKNPNTKTTIISVAFSDTLYFQLLKIAFCEAEYRQYF